MKPKVKLEDIVDAFESQDAESISYVNIRTGAVETIAEEYLEQPNSWEAWGDEPPDWTKGLYALGRKISESNDYLELPSQYDIHEYKIIRDFATDQIDSTIRDRLLETIRGKGAFRRFKDTAFDLGVIDDWYAYKREALSSIALDWCEENDIDVEADDK